MKKNTYNLAYEACEVFFHNTGQIPTIASIKPIITINNPTAISNAIKDWKKSLPLTLKKKHFNNIAIPEPLINAITAIWEQALMEAKSALDNQAIELQAQQNNLDHREKLLTNKIAHFQQLMHRTEQKHTKETSDLQKEINRLCVESNSILEKTEHYRALSAELKKNNIALSKQIHSEQDKYNRLEKQYDKEHDWALKRIEEEKNSYKKHVHNEIQQVRLKANRSKQALDLLQAKAILMAKEINAKEDKIKKLEKNLADVKSKQKSTQE
jgi:hypothetical protein